MKILTKFIVGLLWSIPIMAQDSYHQGPTFHSPEAASLGKYGDIPVSHHTGTANISIPLYTLTDGPLSLPISLSYHSSGIRVDELASQVGLGWSLNAGGMITRSVNGAPDEGRRRSGGRSSRNGWGWFKDGGIPPEITDPNSTCGSPNINCFFDNGDPDSEEFCDCRNYSYDAGRGLADTEPDIYSISMPGFSGKFLFNEAGEALTIPKSDVKIEPVLETFDNYLGPNNGRFIHWTVTLPDGTKFFFGESGATENIYNGLSTGDVDYSTSTWYLYRMESVTGDYHIDLTYNDISYRYGSRSGHSVQRGLVTEDINGTIVSGLRFRGTITAAPVPLQWTTVLGKEISQITTSTGAVAVDFERDSTFRRDLLPRIGSTVKPYPLRNIRISSATGAMCKLYELHTSDFISPNVALAGYDDSDQYRLRLDSVTEKSCSGSIINPSYQFTYNTSQPMVRRYSLARDHWGYYNGQDTQTSLLPDSMFSRLNAHNRFDGGANRTPDASKMGAWILTQITYPTGGRVAFNYEPHIDPDDDVSPIGGLRIQSIRRYNPGSNTPTSQSTYHYIQGIYFPGLITSTKSNYVYELMPRWTGPPPTDFGDNDANSSGGYTGGGENGWQPCDAGEMFSSSIIAPMSTSQGNHIAYNLVEVTDENEGKTRFIYNNFVPFNTINHFYHPFPPAAIKIGSGELRTTTYFDENNTPVGEKSVVFDLNDDLESITAVKIQTYNSYCTYPHFSDQSLKHTYTIDVSRLRRTSEVSTQDGVTVTTNNIFGPDHDFPLEVNGTNSDGSSYRKAFTYPTYLAGNVYDTMRTNNQVGNVIVSHSYATPVAGSEVETQKINQIYELTNGVPLIDETRVEPAGSEAVSYFFEYDPYDRVVGSQKEYDVPTCYLYDGYDQPVAKITNLSYQEVVTLMGSNGNTLEDSQSNSEIRSILQDLKNILPEMVLMETYLHEPGVGIIERTDSNGNVIYYDYDELGRLLRVSDKDYYTLKEYKYNFAE